MVIFPSICNYIINRVPTPILHRKSPYQYCTTNSQNLIHSKCLALYVILQHFRLIEPKLDPRENKSIFLGYKLGIKGYIFVDFRTNEVFVSINVIFHEHILPYQSTTQSVRTSSSYFPSKPDNSTSIRHIDHITLAEMSLTHMYPYQHHWLVFQHTQTHLITHLNLLSPMMLSPRKLTCLLQ